MDASIARDETVTDTELRHAGVTYARNHADRLPVVLPVRLLRSFGLYQPVWSTSQDLQLQGGGLRHLGSWVAQLQYWFLLAVGIVGLVLLHRRRQPLLPGLAAVAIDAFWSRRRRPGGTVLVDS